MQSDQSSLEAARYKWFWKIFVSDDDDAQRNDHQGMYRDEGSDMDHQLLDVSEKSGECNATLVTFSMENFQHL